MSNDLDLEDTDWRCSSCAHANADFDERCNGCERERYAADFHVCPRCNEDIEESWVLLNTHPYHPDCAAEMCDDCGNQPKARGTHLCLHCYVESKL